MRKKIVAANWKMNMLAGSGHQLVADIVAGLPALTAVRRVVIAPSHLHLAQTAGQLAGQQFIYVGAQNCHTENAGAFTGEVSAAMLKDTGASYVIIGHSERREYNHEDSAMLVKKIDQALGNGLQVIFCCGEPLAIRDADTQNEYVGQQINEGLFQLTAEQLQHVVIAYEPIWAIGTGRVATSAQAQEMHAHIRSVMAGKYGIDVADGISILYGGSCKPSNAAELFACADVDGGLIGGASLKAEEFLGIIQAMIVA